MTQETAARKDTQRLQRAIIDGLEDVKAQDIAVFDTEHLSPLFERVIVASGTSNRQTKALAASVRDAVRDAGFPKPRTEGEQNGEWIIVDCGAAVAHIMQPAIRTYYHLEEIWGDKPVRLKFGTPKPAVAAPAPVKAAAKKGAAAKTSIQRSSAAKTAVKEAERAAKAVAPGRKKTPARGTAKAPARGTAKAAARETANAPTRPRTPSGARTATKSAAPKSPASKSASPLRKSAIVKTPAGRTASKAPSRKA